MVTVYQRYNPTDGSDTIIGSDDEWDYFEADRNEAGAYLVHRNRGADDNDTWRGLAGYDTFMVGLGKDMFDGGADFDALDFGFYYRPDFLVEWEGEDDVTLRAYLEVTASTVDLTKGTYSVTFGRADGTDDKFARYSGQVRSIESLYGTIGKDIFYGSGVGEVFAPGAGADIIDGRGGIDTLDYAVEGETPDSVEEAGGIVVIHSGVSSGAITDGFGSVDGFRNIEWIYGTVKADRFEGTAGSQSWTGSGSGADVFRGGAGFDLVWLFYDSFGAGSSRGAVVDLQRETGTYGNGDRIVIEDIEALQGSSYGDKLYGGDGANSLYGGGGDDVLDGRSGHDTLVGGAGNDKLTGGDGNDKLTGGDGADTLIGGAGTDTAFYAAAVIVDLAKGKARDIASSLVDSLKTIENIDGSSAADILTGDKYENALYGNGGKDTLNGGDGDDVLIGGDGDDRIDGGKGRDWVDYRQESGTKGLNVMLLNGKALDTYGSEDILKNIEVIFGTDRRDLIRGSNAVGETLYGNGGRDIIDGLGGNDTLRGGLDADRLRGGDGKDVLYGDAGDDTLYGGEGNDRVFGGADKDKIWGEEGNDTLSGGDGDDQIEDGSFTSTSEILSFVNRWYVDGVLVSGKTNVLKGDDGKDTLLGVGIFYGGAGNDTIRGIGILHGDAGNDRLEAIDLDGKVGLATAVLSGGAGNDTLIGGYADYRYATRGVLIDLETGTARAGSSDIDSLRKISGVIGSNFGDTIIMSDDSRTASGKGGNDTIKVHGGGDALRGVYGGDGNDHIVGTAIVGGSYVGDDGDDLLEITGSNAEIWGGNNNDTIIVKGTKTSAEFKLYGDSGNDTFRVTGSMGFVEIEGGSGNDTFEISSSTAAKMMGGSGSDTFVFNVAAHSEILTGTGSDRIVVKKGGSPLYLDDFSRTEDVLDISAINDRHTDTLKEIRKVAEEVDDKVHFTVGNTNIYIDGIGIDDLTAGMFVL